jgi:hypothetical protein
MATAHRNTVIHEKTDENEIAILIDRIQFHDALHLLPKYLQQVDTNWLDFSPPRKLASNIPSTVLELVWQRTARSPGVIECGEAYTVWLALGFLGLFY